MSLVYRTDAALSVDVFIDMLRRSTLAERRPVDDQERIAQMLAHADILCTAWAGDLCVGVARSVTDWAYCCYLSDLAVDRDFQKQGVGKALIELTQKQLHPRCRVILLAAPLAREYYPRIGMERHDSAWTILADRPLT